MAHPNHPALRGQGDCVVVVALPSPALVREELQVTLDVLVEL